MCVIYFAFDSHPQYPLVLAANRDEFYDRPTLPARRWEDHPKIFAGRDLVGGGTWLGITENGRIAAVTNYRDPDAPHGSRSRGALVADFLKGEETAAIYLERVSEVLGEYSGFNLILGEFAEHRTEMFYLSNRDADVRRLEPGIYGLSNHLLNTPWPKVRNGKGQFSRVIGDGSFETESLFDLLADETPAADNELPDTGIGYEKEKALSAVFIRTPIYGTRSSSVVTIDHSFAARLYERVFV